MVFSFPDQLMRPFQAETRLHAPTVCHLPVKDRYPVEPFWDRPAGTETKLAPNKQKLRQEQDTRQGLARVLESNTKYGGKGRKQGGNREETGAARMRVLSSTIGNPEEI